MSPLAESLSDTCSVVWRHGRMTLNRLRAMRWISHQGRLYPPSNDRHLALTPRAPLVVRSRFSARPLSATERQP